MFFTTVFTTVFTKFFTLVFTKVFDVVFTSVFTMVLGHTAHGTDILDFHDPIWKIFGFAFSLLESVREPCPFLQHANINGEVPRMTCNKKMQNIGIL